jgi:hypothetical protein
MEHPCKCTNSKVLTGGVSYSRATNCVFLREPSKEGISQEWELTNFQSPWASVLMKYFVFQQTLYLRIGWEKQSGVRYWGEETGTRGKGLKDVLSWEEWELKLRETVQGTALTHLGADTLLSTVKRLLPSCLGTRTFYKPKRKPERERESTCVWTLAQRKNE